MMKKARQLAKLIERERRGGRELGMQVAGSCGGGREGNENAPT